MTKNNILNPKWRESRKVYSAEVRLITSTINLDLSNDKVGVISLFKNGNITFTAEKSKYNFEITTKDITKADFKHVARYNDFTLVLNDGRSFKFDAHPNRPPTGPVPEGIGVVGLPLFALSTYDSAKNIGAKKSVSIKKAFQKILDPALMEVTNDDDYIELGNKDFKAVIKWMFIGFALFILLVMAFAALPQETKEKILGAN